MPFDDHDALHFTARGASHQLHAGERFGIQAGECYRDLPESDLRAIIAQIERGTPWRTAVAERLAGRDPWLYRIVTDARRDLFFRMRPPPADCRVLDVGSGWGQIALPLARHARVCALEPTAERLDFIQAAARQEGTSKRMWFVQSDFLGVSFSDTFDLVTCIGVLEWVPKFAPSLAPLEAQRAFLSALRRVVAPGGRLVIGIENRLGLKYLLGAPDDHIGHPGVAVYDADLASRKWAAVSGQPLRSLTHTRAEYETLLAEAGFANIAFFAAFPDYKLPEAIVPAGDPADRFLLENVICEHDGIRGEPVPFQEELTSHYRSLAKLGIASDFAPSFFIEASPR